MNIKKITWSKIKEGLIVGCHPLGKTKITGTYYTENPGYLFYFEGESICNDYTIEKAKHSAQSFVNDRVRQCIE